jgi:hypothetical protein
MGRQGHPFGHAIETGSGYGAWLHGEAIAVGMCMAADLSRRLGWLAAPEAERIRALTLAAGLPVAPPPGLGPERYMDLMAVDKKVLAGRLRLVLLRGIGAMNRHGGALTSYLLFERPFTRTLIDLGYADTMARARGDFGFASGRSTHADRLATIRRCWQQHGTLVDTHTADGLKVAWEQRESGVPMIVLETALPAKFAATIREATGIDPEPPAGLRHLESLPRRFTVVPPDVAAVKAYLEEHAIA